MKWCILNPPNPYRLYKGSEGGFESNEVVHFKPRTLNPFRSRLKGSEGGSKMKCLCRAFQTRLEGARPRVKKDMASNKPGLGLTLDFMLLQIRRLGA